MQSGRGNQKKWILEFETRDSKNEPLMGWEASDDTLGELNLNQAHHSQEKSELREY